jgi:hypothetical protein
MKPIETRQRFRDQLEDLGLDPDHLDPWSGWRAFKVFLQQGVEGWYDAASVQVRPENDAASMFSCGSSLNEKVRAAIQPISSMVA